MNYDFSRQISAIVKRTNIAVANVVERIALDISNRIIMKTPVDVGTLRGNWMPSYNTINYATDLSATDSVGRVTTSIRGAEMIGKVWYLTNSMPYAYRIEYEGWSHTKAPQGMVRVSVTEVRSNLNSLIRGA